MNSFVINIQKNFLLSFSREHLILYLHWDVAIQSTSICTIEKNFENHYDLMMRGEKMKSTKQNET